MAVFANFAFIELADLAAMIEQVIRDSDAAVFRGQRGSLEDERALRDFGEGVVLDFPLCLMPWARLLIKNADDTSEEAVTAKFNIDGRSSEADGRLERPLQARVQQTDSL